MTLYRVHGPACMSSILWLSRRLLLTHTANIASAFHVDNALHVDWTEASNITWAIFDEDAPGTPVLEGGGGGGGLDCDNGQQRKRQLRTMPSGCQASMLSPGAQVQTAITAEVFPR